MAGPRTIPLGFAVGTGQPVHIPMRNMCVAGQTQEAGKTTALEALITRAGVRAVTFITKRGEGSFTTARQVRPYFREQADWQFVASILEASRGEKLKFERAWIIRASKGARTLADVQANVRLAMKTAKGLAGDVYLTLDAYLEAVVPAIARVRWAPKLELEAGVNAIDLTQIQAELQHLVIRSSIDWVLGQEDDTIVVIPEAWKFVPQGRGTPVKQAAAALIRQGSGLRDYVWLDSQDLGGVEKEILRSCPVWLLGVQREANEIKRTLANIPAGIAKPSAADIATLALGQFYACYGPHAIKTYVQPAWMGDINARAIAMGHITIADVKPRLDGRPVGQKEQNVTNEEAVRLTRENEKLITENADLRKRVEALERIVNSDGKPKHAVPRESPDAPTSSRRRGSAGNFEELNNEVLGTRGAGPAQTAAETFVNEALYQAIKARLIDEAPALVRLLVDRPEIEVRIERRVITAEGASTIGRVARLIREDFLADSKRFSEILRELERTGTRINNKSLSVALQELVVSGFLTKESVDRYRAVPDMKVRVVEAA